MKIRNINKKVLAGLLGVTILTTPLGLTACGHKLNEKNSYEDVNDYVILTLDTKNGETIWLTREEEFLENYSVKRCNYYDVFNGEIILKTRENISQIEGVETVSKENFQQYLIAYDCVQKNYTKEEIEELFNKVKEDFYNNEKGKELVKR